MYLIINMEIFKASQIFHVSYLGIWIYHVLNFFFFLIGSYMQLEMSRLNVDLGVLHLRVMVFILYTEIDLK